MKKISRNTFLSRIPLDSYKFYSPDIGIEPIPGDLIYEFKLKSKYFYSASSIPALLKIHSSINEEILKKIPISGSATAYVNGKSYFDFLEPHRNNYFFIRIDIKNFFHSIGVELIEEVFSHYFDESSISEKSQQNILKSFVNLVTINIDEHFKNVSVKGRAILPIGFKTSPLISNIVFRKIDHLLQDFCFRNSITYTRYADDLLFSTPFNTNANPFIHSERFIQEIEFILNLDGYKINSVKTIKSYSKIILNGYIINGTSNLYVPGNICISNRKLKAIDKTLIDIDKKISFYTILFNRFYNNNLFSSKISSLPEVKRENFCKDQIINKLTGYRSFLLSIFKYNDKTQSIDVNHLKKYKKTLDKIEGKLKKLM